MFPLFKGGGARLLRALTWYSLDVQSVDYTEVRPPTLVLTEALTASGHLPKFVDEAYAVERDGLWAIPTAEVPLTSMHRGELLEESALPLRYCATTPCFRREAGAAGKDTRGLLRVHEFDKTELFAYCTEAQAPDAVADIVRARRGRAARGSACSTACSTCASASSATRTRGPSTSRPTPRASTAGSRSPRSAGTATTRRAARTSATARAAAARPVMAHTVNGSVLGWVRVFAAVVETYRQADGSIRVPDVLVRYVGTDVITAP